MRTRSDGSTVLQANIPIVYDDYWFSRFPPENGAFRSPPSTFNMNVAVDKIVQSESSIITDELVRAHRIKEAHHSKYSYRYIPSGGYTVINYQGDNLPDHKFVFNRGDYVLQNDLCGPYNWWPLLGAGDYSVSWGASDEALLNKALHSFMDGNEVDNFTNIREAGQTVALVQSMGETWKNSLLWLPSRQLIKRASRLGRIIYLPDWSKAIKVYSNKFKMLIKAAPGDIANGWLAYSFGVAPLVSDLKTMAKAYTTLGRDLERNRHKGQRRIAHARCDGAISVTWNNDRYYPPYGNAHASNRLVLSLGEASAVKTATVHGKDTTSYRTDLFKDLDYLGKKFLSAGPGSAIWEAIPYSFVLDWFLNTSAVIDHIDNTLTGSTKRVVDGCISTKVVISSASTVKLPFNPYQNTGAQGLVFGTSDISEYHRVPTLPSFWIGKSGRFGKKQGSLMGALLHQRVANLVTAEIALDKAMVRRLAKR